MFDKGTAEKLVEVVVDLSNGREIFGWLVCGANGKLGSVLNSEGQFVELRDNAGQASFISKASICAVEPAKGGQRAMPVLQMSQDENHGWASVLQVLPTSDFETVKAAYYRLAKQYHPDLYPAHMPKEMRRYANEMFKRINQAWEKFQNIRLAA